MNERHKTIELVAYAMWENGRHHLHHLGALDYWLMAEQAVIWFEPFSREADNVVRHHGAWGALRDWR